jgi:tetratricopeptide (TPR) repeat protein
MRIETAAHVALLAVALGGATGCANRAARPLVPSERATAPSTAVSDDAFAGALHDLLVSEPGSHERAERLAGVEAKQMDRAATRFRAHAAQRGTAATLGGLSLIHTGELTQGLLGASGPDALVGSVRDISGRGDEGEARALYEILAKIGADAVKADARQHLDALQAWTKDAVASGGSVASASGLAHVAVRRRLLEPSQVALDEAVAATTTWFNRTRELERTVKATHQQPPREEMIAAWRGFQTAPALLVSLYLHDANAAKAVAALDALPDARPLLEKSVPDLAAALDAVADAPDSSRWLDVVHALRPLAHGNPQAEEDDFADDREVFRSAELGAALEAYRLDPSTPEAAVIVAAYLADLGMAEAAPAIVYEAAKAHPDARTLGVALSITLTSLSEQAQVGDVDGARRAFHAAQPLLAIADQHASVRPRPSSAVVRAVMGEIELGEGHLDAARALLKASVAEEKSGQVLLTLAKIDWRDKQVAAAEDGLKQALQAPDVTRNHALRAEVLVTESDILREQGDTNGARSALVDALRDLTQARAGQADDRMRAAIERALAKVLDRFGASQPASRALERAYDAAPRDKQQIAQTVFQIIGRAFVHGDLAAARDGLARGVAADLEMDDLVYFALWVRLLERQQHSADASPAVDHIFASAQEDPRWIGRLAQFGLGKLKASELAAAAKTPSQQVEALFYSTMDKRASGDTSGIEEALKQVVGGTGVGLEEVSLARDLLNASHYAGPLPPDVAIP